jgi:hypothetical protein
MISTHGSQGCDIERRSPHEVRQTRGGMDRGVEARIPFNIDIPQW